MLSWVWGLICLLSKKLLNLYCNKPKWQGPTSKGLGSQDSTCESVSRQQDRPACFCGCCGHFQKGEIAVSRRTNPCYFQQTRSFTRLGRLCGVATYVCPMHPCVPPSLHTRAVCSKEQILSVWFSSKVFLKEVLLFQMCKAT